MKLTPCQGIVTTTFAEGADYVESLGGVDWYEAGKAWSKLRKRLPHRHFAQTRASMHGTYIERCPCGAYGPRPWLRKL